MCIFCDSKTDYSFGRKGRSICLKCLIKLKKLEYKNRQEITKKVLPSSVRKMVQEAASTTKQISTAELSPADKDLIKTAKRAIRTLKI